MLSQELHIHPDDLRTYILGEHGPNQFPILSSAEAGGERISDTPYHRELFAQVIEAGFEVYRLKGLYRLCYCYSDLHGDRSRCF